MIRLLKLLPVLVFVISCNIEPITSIEKKQFDIHVDTPSAEPYLFTTGSGEVYLSWIEKRKDSSLLKFSTLKNDQWSEPTIIASGDSWFVNWADYPMLAVNGNTLLSHFLEKSEKGNYTYDVKFTLSSDQGEKWSDPKILHDDGKKAEHGFVSMIPFGDSFFVSWLDGRNAVSEGSGHEEGHHGAMTLRAAIINKAGIKTSEWELDQRVCDCCQTSVAITKNGPVVIYRDRTNDEIRDISIVRFLNGSWTSPKSIYDDLWKIDGCPVNGPRVDAIDNNLVIAWFSSPGNRAGVKVVFSEDGGASFASPIKIDGGKAIGRVDVTMINSNTAIVSWMEGSVIRAARVYSDGKFDPSVVIANSATARSSGFPQMTKWGDKLIFAWTDDKEKKIKVASVAGF